MATEGIRRSARVRKPVKSYATEQAEESSIIASLAAPRPSKRKRTNIVSEDNDGVQPRKRLRKDSKAASEDNVHGDYGDGGDGDGEEENLTKKRPSKTVKSADAEYEDGDAAFSARKRQRGKSEEDSNATTTGWIKKGLSVFVVDPKTIKDDTSWHAEAAQRRNAATQRNVRELAAGEEEKRLRPYVDEPPPTYHTALKKVSKERMFVLSRERGTETSCHAHHQDCPCEMLQVAGSKGNIYTINITHIPTCDCPANVFMRKKEQSACKHVLYVLHNVLKVSGHLKQQNAFLTSELKEIFRNAPALPSGKAPEDDFDGKRKSIEGDCPICFTEFDEDEQIVWCRAACGNNIHKHCLEEWITRAKATCPYCRAAWQVEATKNQKVEVAKVNMDVTRGAGGYRNVYDQLNYGEDD